MLTTDVVTDSDIQPHAKSGVMRGNPNDSCIHAIGDTSNTSDGEYSVGPDCAPPTTPSRTTARPHMPSVGTVFSDAATLPAAPV